jgi:peptide/nickel transport system substrate-binding protein
MTKKQMMRGTRTFAIAGGLLVAMLVADTALAQKPGGVLRMYHFDSPASLSLHEEVLHSVRRWASSTISSCSIST